MQDAKTTVEVSDALFDQILDRVSYSEGECCPIIVLREMMEDCEIRNHPSSEFRSELRRIMAGLGIYRAHSSAQIAQYATTGGRKPYDWKKGDSFYVFESWTPLDSVRVVTGPNGIEELRRILSSRA